MVLDLLYDTIMILIGHNVQGVAGGIEACVIMEIAAVTLWMATKTITRTMMIRTMMTMMTCLFIFS